MMAKTYLVNRPRLGTMRLRSIQPSLVWEHLKEYKTLYVDPEWADTHLKDWPDAYNWMREQMALRLAEYEGYYPWWGWYDPKPDLREWRFRIPIGEHYVRLELAVPQERVLLSNEQAWLSILNRNLLPLIEEELDQWDQELDRMIFDKRGFPVEPWRSLMLRSWERIFDLDLVQSSVFHAPFIQGTFERLDLSDVVSVTEFVGCLRDT